AKARDYDEPSSQGKAVNERDRTNDKSILETRAVAALERIASALERLAPPAPAAADLAAADAFLWRSDLKRLDPVKHVNRVELRLLKGIDQARDLLLDNTDRFARALPANNALLWGAR